MGIRRSEPRDPASVARARAVLPPTATSAELMRLRKVLCDPVRCRIVQALAAGPLSVEDLALVVDRNTAATSQHLRVLRDLCVVDVKPAGRVRYYCLRSKGFAGRLTSALRALEELAA